MFQADVRIRMVRMSDDMTTDVINITKLSTLMAGSGGKVKPRYIVKELNKKYGPYWHCFVAHDDAGLISYCSSDHNMYINFETCGYHVVIFKSPE